MPEKILAILPQDLPGIVMAEPALRALKTNLPKAQIFIGVSPRWIPLAKNIPGVGDVIPYKANSPASIWTLQRKKIHRGILFKSSTRSALWLWLARVRKRIGFRRFAVTFFLNRRVKKMPQKYRDMRVRHMVELIRFFGCQVDDRIPQWGRFENPQGAAYICKRGAHERLSSSVCQKWLEAGFEILDADVTDQEAFEKICHARIVVGPPDSVVTLAQALGIAQIRLSRHEKRFDEIPGQEALVLAPETLPHEALKIYEDFQNKNREES